MSTILKYGIDFGTTNSSIAIIDASDQDFPRAKVFEVDERAPYEILRSVVAYKNEDIYVGDEGLEYVGGSEDNPVRQVKLTLIESRRDEHILTHKSKKFYCSDVIAEILRTLRQKAEPHLNGISPDGVVMGVPYGTITDVKNVYITALVKAGFFASREDAYERTEFVEEPVAVALFYGNQIAYQNHYSLVFDYGGGTLDMAVVQLNAGTKQHEIIAKEGYEGAGEKMTGLLFTRVFFPAYADRYFEGNRRSAMKVFKKMGYNANTLPGIWTELGKTGGIGWKFINALDKAKQELSTAEECTFAFHLDETDDNPEITIEKVILTRKNFEEAIAEDLGEINRAVTRLLNSKNCRELNITKASIDEVLLAGGSSIIPAVRKTLADIFGNEKIHFDSKSQGGYLINVMTGIAQGLAWAGYRPNNEMRIDDITSFDYGFIDRINNSIITIIEKGTRLSDAPASLFTGYRLPPNNYKYSQSIVHKDKNTSYFFIEITEGDHIVKTLHFNRAKHSGNYTLYFAVDEKRGLIEVHVYDTISGEWVQDLPLGDRSIEMSK